MTFRPTANAAAGRITRRAALQAMAVGAIGAAVAGCELTVFGRSVGGPTQASIALDWYPWSNHTGLILARDDGHYSSEGLSLALYVPANPEDGLKLVAAGKDTFTISYQTDVLLARAEGIPVKSIAALVQHPLNTVMALSESGIARPKQLEGRRLGMPGLPSDEALLATMMEKDGSSADRVEQVDVGFDLVPALISKQVDAVIGGYWVHESILAEQRGYPVNVMRVEEWGVPDYYELVLVASDETVRDRADLARRFLRATVKGYQAAMQNHSRALEVLFKESRDADRQMETEGIELLAPLWVDARGRFGVQAPERWQAYTQWMQSRGLLKPEVNAADAYAADLLP